MKGKLTTLLFFVQLTVGALWFVAIAVALRLEFPR